MGEQLFCVWVLLVFIQALSGRLHEARQSLARQRFALEWNRETWAWQPSTRHRLQSFLEDLERAEGDGMDYEKQWQDDRPQPWAPHEQSPAGLGGQSFMFKVCLLSEDFIYGCRLSSNTPQSQRTCWLVIAGKPLSLSEPACTEVYALTHSRHFLPTPKEQTNNL